MGFYSRRKKLGSTLEYGTGIYTPKLRWESDEISGFWLNQPNRILTEDQAQQTQTGGWWKIKKLIKEVQGGSNI